MAVARLHGCVVGKSILYVSATQINMGNDFWWPNFNATGAYAYVANWYTLHLMLHSADDVAVALDNVEFADVTPYNPTSTVISSSVFSPLIALYESANTVSHAVDSLRAHDVCGVPQVMTQYCWLDFDKQYAMANLLTLQQRCHANGTFYLESMLRNIGWVEFAVCWGNHAFEFAFADALRATHAGVAWLQQTNTAVFNTPVNVEVAFWVAHGIDHDTTQFQNFKSLGLTKIFSIENAIGIAVPMALKHTTAAWLPSQTTMKLYWAFGMDIVAITSPNSPVFGSSVLAASATVAYAN
ncbi:Aste57867_9156 [Aphanomyces stellatus]|uniref:Aste57867_9156 protein n=1 Tax=Aphanomyces stellatus TaxID=120398 RepID=A0A485KMC6_9STRA|nr:hypothetical protein As57867_009120 [Aphanomyces stellatus]VFT86040.1 Aste57867_9156 [Aphanomyces stellatus]